MARSRISVSMAALVACGVLTSAGHADIFYRGTTHVFTPPTTPGNGNGGQTNPPAGQTSPLTATAAPIAVMQGVAVATSVVSAGGSAPITYSWESTSAQRPAWLNLNTSTGALTGTAAVGTWPAVKVKVSDADEVYEVSFDVTVTGILTAAFPSIVAENGDAISASITPIGGKAPYAYAWKTPSASRPTWLTLDPATGALSGPAGTGSWQDLEITVTDQTQTYDVKFSVTVAAGSNWVAQLGNTGNDVNSSVAVGGGGVYVMGMTSSSGSGSEDMLVTKLGASGDLQWARTMGNTGSDAANAGVAASDGVYSVGYAYAAAPNYTDIVVAKYSTSGAVLWKRAFGGIADDRATGVAIGSDGIYVVGNVTLGTNQDVVLMKYGFQGNLEWYKTIGATNTIDAANAVTVSGSNVYVAGTSAGNILIARFTTAGDFVWAKNPGGNGTEQVYSVKVSGTDLIVGGYTNSLGAGGNDMMVVRFTLDGVPANTRTFGTAGTDYAYGLDVVGDDIYLAGQSTYGTDVQMVYAKVTKAGAVTWARSLGGAGKSDISVGLAAASGKIYVAGFSAVPGYGSNDAVTVRVASDGSGASMGSYDYATRTLSLGAAAWAESPLSSWSPQSPVSLAETSTAYLNEGAGTNLLSAKIN